MSDRSESSAQFLSACGVSTWLDDLSRERIESGELSRLIRDESVVGVTTNPAIFAKAFSEDPVYARRAQQLPVTEGAERRAFELLAGDVRDACDVLSEVFASSDRQDGWVSLEVSPTLADDAEATVRQAHDLVDLVARPNLMMKVPATTAGFSAIEELIAAGISVNVTLVFSVEQYTRAHQAYARGIARRIDSGQEVHHVASVASVFVSRFDSAVSEPSGQIPTVDGLSLGVLNGNSVYEKCQALHEQPQWKRLEAAGARRQRVLWASTGVKTSTLSASYYTALLAWPETVNTMPLATLNAIAAAELRELTQLRRLNAPESLSLTTTRIEEMLTSVGRDYAQLTSQLLAEGLVSFAEAWSTLLRSLEGAGNASS